MGCTHLRDFALLTESLIGLGIKPPAKLLELACGAGWAADLLSQMEFEVVGSTINPIDVKEGRLRPDAHRLRRMRTMLQFVCVPMEDVHAATAHLGLFDAVYVYEALHHAYDWRKACEQVYACLKPGGWFLIATNRT
jgi:SAM-dependent methyltransferase